MNKGLIITIVGFLVLSLGAFVTGRLVVRSTPPPTPKTTTTIPEGWSVDQINEHLKEEGVLVDGELPGDLEGYLFPDTYEFFLDSSVDVVRDRFLSHLGLQLSLLGLDLESNKTREALTMASLIQAEIGNEDEMRVASGVLWKRLETGVPLQVDATLCYIKAQAGQKCLPILKSDKETDSPYNTYLYQDLPPAPIGNPGLEAIKAALNPARSPYWYYLSDPETGKTIFAVTLDEHNLNVIKYLSE